MHRYYAVSLVSLLVVGSGACLRGGFGASGTDGAADATADASPVVEDSAQPVVELGVSANDVDDAALLDAGLLDAANPFQGYAIVSFARHWTVSNSAAVLWQCTGAPPANSHYQLCVGASAGAAASAAARCVGPDADPSLAVLDCGGGALSRLGTVYDLTAGTAAYVQLRLLAKDGRALLHPPLRLDPPAQPSKRVVIFDEGIETANIYGAGSAVNGGPTASGSLALEASTTPNTWTEFGIKNLALALDGLTNARFANGYVELYVDAAPGVDGSLLWVFFGLETDWLDYTPPAGYAYADNKTGYQRIQVPLPLFFERKTGKKMTAQTLGAANRFVIGSRWGNSGKARLDSVAIYY